MQYRSRIAILLFLVFTSPNGFAQAGHAGPGWSIGFGRTGVEMDSLGSVLFAVDDRLFVGPTISYTESSGEGPSRIIAGPKVEWYIPDLSDGPYATSLSLSALAGATDLIHTPVMLVSVQAEANANLMIFPGLILGAGPSIAVELGEGRFSAAIVVAIPQVSTGRRSTSSPSP